MAPHDTTGPPRTDGPADLGPAGARIGLRPVTPADEPFLCAVYGSTRADELALVDWDEGQKAAFVQMQFTAQHRYYQEHYADASIQIILCDRVPAGRLYVARWPAEIRAYPSVAGAARMDAADRSRPSLLISTAPDTVAWLLL